MADIRYTLLALVIFCIGFSPLRGQQADEKFADLLEKSDYFELLRLSPQLQQEFRWPVSAHLLQAVLNSAFNHPGQA